MLKLCIETKNGLTNVSLLETETNNRIPIPWTNEFSVYLSEGLQASVGFDVTILNIVTEFKVIQLKVNPDWKGHDDEVITILNLLAKSEPPMVRLVSNDGCSFQIYDMNSDTEIKPIVDLEVFTFEPGRGPWAFLSMEIESPEKIIAALDENIFDINPSKDGEYLSVTMKNAAAKGNDFP